MKTRRFSKDLLRVHVTEEERRQLDAIGRRKQMSRSAVIREFIWEYLAAHYKGEANPQPEPQPGPPPPPPQPATLFLRPRDIRALWPDTTNYILRQLRESGSIRAKHGYYSAEEIAEKLPIELPKSVEPPAPLPGLLRLRGIRKRFGFRRDLVEGSVKAGVIKPFLKCTKAKALYPTWQLLRLRAEARFSSPEPDAPLLRRRIVTKWLGVTATELESWVQLELIHRADGYYFKDEIKQKVLGLQNV